MPDAYSIVTELDPAVAEQLADAMELRATDPQQQAMLAAYLDDLAMPDGATVLEIGCGTGAQAPLGQDIDLGGLFGHQRRLPLG
jgi:ubiquinone/menaquinone biosynthesis C-methylase UbiE